MLENLLARNSRLTAFTDVLDKMDEIKENRPSPNEKWGQRMFSITGDYR